MDIDDLDIESIVQRQLVSIIKPLSWNSFATSQKDYN